MFDCFGVRFVPTFSKKAKLSKWTKKSGKWDKHGHNLIAFSQATGQTWYHTSAYYLSAHEI